MMATPNRISNITRDALKSVPSTFQGLIDRILEGKDPKVGSNFTELKLPRGTNAHPPSTDRREVRNSLSIQINGAPGGSYVAHLFNDGTIKRREEMHRENNAWREEEKRLAEEERKFPELHQTPAREEAHQRMMDRINHARNSSWSIMQEQIEKSNALEEYRAFLQAQAVARASAAQSKASSRC